MSGQNSNNILDTEILDSLAETLGPAVARIISIYIDEFPISIQTMRDALSQADYETIGRAAHSLKSSSGNLGATQIEELAIALEKNANNNPQEAHVIELINKLEYAFKKVSPKLTSYMS